MTKLTVTLKRYVKGIISFLPATGRFFREPTGGTDSARYCYAVWLRHLTMARESGLSDNPRVVAELGPGDSIGTGLVALLTGAEKYYALSHIERRSFAHRFQELLNDDLTTSISAT